MEERYDLAIVGLGPAGATLARLLDGRLRAAAFDKKGPESGERPFQKPCGGLLAPDAQRALADCGLSLPKEVLVGPQIFFVRTLDLDSGLSRCYRRFYLNVDRARFDQWLIGQIPEQVERFPACARAKRADGGFRLFWREGGAERSLWARWLVGADGANSLVRRAFFSQPRIRRYTAIQQWFPETHPKPFYSCVFDSQNTDCYSWSISKDGRFIFGGAYPARDARARFERQKSALAQLGFCFGEPLRTEACLVLRPASPAQFATGGDGVFLIGEAAGFVSPSSLEGISPAILSGRALAGVLRAGGGHPERDYRRATFPLRAKLAGKLLKCPALYNPFLRRLVMKSGLQSLNPEK